MLRPLEPLLPTEVGLIGFM